MNLDDAIQTLTEAGAVFSLPRAVLTSQRAAIKEALLTLQQAGAVVASKPAKHLALSSAAEELDCGLKWLRTHLAEFPNAWRLPGGQVRVPAEDVASLRERRELGEIRVPRKDVDALAERNRLRRAA